MQSVRSPLFVGFDDFCEKKLIKVHVLPFFDPKAEKNTDLESENVRVHMKNTKRPVLAHLRVLLNFHAK